MVNHGLLNRVKLAIVAGDALYCADNRLVGHGQQKNTGIYRLIDQLAAPPPSQHYRTGPAITFCTAFLATYQALPAAQYLQQGGVRPDIVYLAGGPVYHQAYRPGQARPRSRNIV